MPKSSTLPFCSTFNFSFLHLPAIAMLLAIELFLAFSRHPSSFCLFFFESPPLSGCHRDSYRSRLSGHTPTDQRRTLLLSSSSLATHPPSSLLARTVNARKKDLERGEGKSRPEARHKKRKSCGRRRMFSFLSFSEGKTHPGASKRMHGGVKPV